MNKEMPRHQIKEISVAPMMDWTDRHCRYFLRLISPHALLYTEMVTSGAIIHGRRDRFLGFHPAEHPVALQLGGSDPVALAECAKIGADYGYDEINLNCGCPSDRVQNGAFGACLMKDPGHVSRIIESMIRATSVPITVKCRIGVDDCDDFSFLNNFVEQVSQAGCQKFIIHARKAWLNGLSPKENREIPPLDYKMVEQIKCAYPRLTIILNGGLKSSADVRAALTSLDGAMIGREAYQNPYQLLSTLERDFFGFDNVLPRAAVARAMIPYCIQMQKDHGTPVKSITRHMMGLYKGQHGGAVWRRYLSENAHSATCPARLIEGALAAVETPPVRQSA